MNKFKIQFKQKTKFIEEIQKEDYIETMKPQGFIKSIFSSKQYPDIYFHSGNVDEDSLDTVVNSKLTIVNSYSTMQQMRAKLKMSDAKIEVLFPSINVDDSFTKETKKTFKEKYGIKKGEKVILFTSKNLKSAGIKNFIDIVNQIENDSIKIIIEGEAKQIFNLKFQISKYDFQDRLVLLEDYPSKDELFYVADIFILPTENRAFATNVLKAMYYKCAVFVSAVNQANEIIDVFARIESMQDRSLFFKLDALLANKDELKKIKKDNKKIALDYTIEKTKEKFQKIIEGLN